MHESKEKRISVHIDISTGVYVLRACVCMCLCISQAKNRRKLTFKDKNKIIISQTVGDKGTSRPWTFSFCLFLPNRQVSGHSLKSDSIISSGTCEHFIDIHVYHGKVHGMEQIVGDVFLGRVPARDEGSAHNMQSSADSGLHSTAVRNIKKYCVKVAAHWRPRWEQSCSALQSHICIIKVTRLSLP